MLPYKKSYFRMTYENKFSYRIIYRIIFESIVFTYYIKSNGSLYWSHILLCWGLFVHISTKALCSSSIAFIITSGVDIFLETSYIWPTVTLVMT